MKILIANLANGHLTPAELGNRVKIFILSKLDDENFLRTFIATTYNSFVNQISTADRCGLFDIILKNFNINHFSANSIFALLKAIESNVDSERHIKKLYCCESLTRDINRVISRLFINGREIKIGLEEAVETGKDFSNFHTLEKFQQLNILVYV